MSHCSLSEAIEPDMKLVHTRTICKNVFKALHDHYCPVIVNGVEMEFLTNIQKQKDYMLTYTEEALNKAYGHMIKEVMIGRMLKKTLDGICKALTGMGPIERYIAMQWKKQEEFEYENVIWQ